MGVLDFEAVFDILDPARHGFLTDETVQQYDELLHTLPLDIVQVRACIQQLCGGHKHVSRASFVQVLQDLERRRALEEQLRWDFMALDQSGSTHLPLTDGLMLFTMAHGDQFSMQSWNQFLQSRGENRDEDVYFDEIKIWLCNIAEGPPATPAEIMDEQRRLEALQNQRMQHDLYRHVQFQNDEIERNRLRQDHNDKMRRLAQRKMNRWEEDGVEALLFDDGRENFDEVEPMSKRRHLGLTELTEALQTKYDLLRKKLFWHMLQSVHGEAAWTELSDAGRIQLFQQLQHQERQMREEGFLDTQAVDLTGSQVPHQEKLVAILGEMQEAHEKRLSGLSAQRMELMAHGKGERDVDSIQRDAFQQDGKGPVNSVDILVSLDTRYLEEKEWIMNMLRSDNAHKWSTAKASAEYLALVRQHMLAELEPEFTAACLAVGLAERQQQYKPDRFDPDRTRQESLALGRLRRERTRSKFPYEDGEKERDKQKSALQLCMDIVKELVWKHLLERETMVEFLVGPESEVARSGAKQLSDDHRAKRVTSLRNQRNKWREYSKGYRASQKNAHLKILLEGTAIYFVNTRQEKQATGEKNLSDDVISACVLADLQQKHDLDMQAVSKAMQGKGEEELRALKKEQRRLRKEGVCDAVAAVVLGSTQVTADDRPLLDALDAKYTALRNLLFTHVLRLEHGVSFLRLPEPDRQKLIVKKTDEEERLRQEGKMEEMARLIERFPKDLANLRLLMGEDKAEYGRRIKDLAELSMQAVVSGKPVDKAVMDEKPVNQVKAVNLLADLISRAYSEEDAILAHQRTKADISLQEKLVPLVMLKIERLLTIREEQFDIGATSVGLVERILAVSQGQDRHSTDGSRQIQLARLRVESHRRRLELGRRYRRETDDGKPEAGDTLGWMEGYVREMVKKHREEREVLMSVFQDESMEELRESAKSSMTDEERHRRLAQLHGKRHKLDMALQECQDTNIDIIEEASAIRYVLKKASIEAVERREVTPDTVLACLLTDVQEAQDIELAKAVAAVGKMDIEDLSMARTIEINARHWGSVDNVLNVLTRYEGSAQDNDIFKALESKYDPVRDELLVIGLQQQHGTQWSAMSAAVRHTHLLQAAMQHRQLTEEGKFADAARLLGNADVGPLHQFLGQTRPQYHHSLQRIQGNIPIVEEEMDEDEAELARSDNVFELLHRRCQREKQVLVDRLKGVSGKVVTEADRHLLLARYAHEKRRAGEETDLESTSLCLGLSERQQASLEFMNPRDRKRQEQLAEIRVQAVTEGKTRESAAKTDVKAKEKEAMEIVKTGDTFAFMDSVMKKLHYKHQHEVTFLFDLIKSAKNAKQDQIEFINNLTEVDRQNRLDQLSEKRESLPLDKSKEQHALLQEACMLKRATRCRWLAQRSGGLVAEHEQEVTVSLLADLQQRHDMEAESCLQLKTSQADLVKVQESLVYERKCAMVSNVAAVLLEPDDIPDSQEYALVQTLEDKYDALRDKLIAEALINQMGEKDWERLTEQERQRKMIELRLKEKKLRREGRYDEAAAILGDALKNQEEVDKLLGIQREEHERRMRERLALRQQRLAEGFTEEEVDKMEEEEEKEYRKKRNLLADLEGVFEKEKEELLRNLAGYKDAAAAERARQLELARLKREQRKVKEEEKFSAAALFIGMHREQEQEQEECRKKQEQLARERLNEKLRMRKENMKKTFKEVPHPQNGHDVQAWHEAVTKEMEVKHAEERDFLIAMMADPLVAQYREQARGMDTDAQADRLEQLKLMRRLMKEKGGLASNEHVNLLREATALRLELLAAQQPEGSEEDAPQVALLSDLQEEQDAEMNDWIQDARDKSAESLKQVKLSQELSRRQQWNDSLAAVVLDDRQRRGGGAMEEKEVMDELEKKYDMVLDKLLEQALRNQFGDQAWNNMSPQEQQEHLVKLKLQNRKLREEGKLDEANELLGGLLDDDDILKQLGDSKSQQRQNMQDKLQRKRELIAERKAKGLSTDDAVLETILEEEAENQPKKKRNVLEQLQSHFDDEKEALLAALRGYEDSQLTEKQRQLQLARLKREQRRLQKEERYQGAATLIAVANEQGKAKEAFNTGERERMKQLARERLEARRRDVQARRDAEQELLQEEQERQVQEAKVAEAVNAEGEVVLQAGVLTEVQIKQDKERDKMADLITEATTLPTIATWIAGLKPDERKLQLEKLRQERSKWRNKQLSQLGQQAVGEGSSKLSDARLAELAAMREEQHTLLVRALALRIAVEKEQMRAHNPFLGEGELQQEVSVTLLADLQHKQGLEMNALTKLVDKQSEAELRELKDTQVTACREGWYDNLTHVLFTMGGPESAVASPRSPAIIEDEGLYDDLEAEYEAEKEQLLKQMEEEGKSSEEIEVENNKLLSKFENRREKLQEVLARQKQAAEERVAAGQQVQASQQYEDHVANQMSKLANREVSSLQKAEQDKGLSDDTLSDKVAARRAARKQAMTEDDTPPSSAGSDRMSRTTKARSIDNSLLFGAMKREKTVVDVQMSDEQIAEKQQELMRRMAASNQKLAAEQRAHEDRVQTRIREMKEKRQRGVDEIFSNMERQKTSLERVHRGEQERQRNKMREEIERRARSKSVEAREFQRTLQQNPDSSLHEQMGGSTAGQPNREKTHDERMGLVVENGQTKQIQKNKKTFKFV